jgi:uroporphyrinogen-III synthase
MPQASFQGLRVLALESRRANEIAKLIRTYGGEPTVAPAMREVPLASNHEALNFAASLMRGEFDLVVFLTGAGIRCLMNIVQTEYDRDTFLTALRGVKVAARGPKSSAVLREFQVPVTVTAPEPCTWRELMGAIESVLGRGLNGLRIAVQEYGAPNPDLLAALRERNCIVTRVPVYQWALPEDLTLLRECVHAIAERRVDVVLFMTAIQVVHLWQVAEQMHCLEEMYDGFNDTVVLSIGPSTSEELRRHGVLPDFEPSHPKMGFLVNESAQCAGRLLEGKRPGHALTKLPSQQVTSFGPRARDQAVGETAYELRSKKKIPTDIESLHAIGSRMAAADPFHAVLEHIVDFVSTLVMCDSCFIYVLEQDRLVLRASQNPHADIVDHLGLRLGQGITGWVGQHREPVVIASNALKDPRFKIFKDVPEDLFEAFLSVPILCRGKLVGVINVQHRQPYHHTPREVQMISTIGFLVGGEIEMARLESEKTNLSDQLETRKHVERAKGILQREFGLNEEEAYRTMQKESRQRRKTMRDIAEAIILSEELRRDQSSRKQ